MRILVVTRNFPPLCGGMERLNWHLVEQLSQRFEVQVIAPDGAAGHVCHGVTVTEVPLRPLWRFLTAGCLQTVRQAIAWKPEVVLAGSGLTAPLALLAARASGARAMAYVHGLDLTVSHPVYRMLWRPALRRLDRVIANSSPTQQLARDIGIAADIAIVHPGVSVPGSVRPESAQLFRAAHGLGDGPILLSVGRLVERKGLREFVRDVLPGIVAKRPAVQLVVIGTEPANSLHASVQTVESIRAVAVDAGVEQHIHFLGQVSDGQLAMAYAAADVHVFPVRCIPGDPEGFGMVAVEAAAYGTPTVAYATGGVVDAVSEGKSGRLVAPGNTTELCQAVVSVLDQPPDAEGVVDFARKFSWERFGCRIAELVSEW